MACCTLRAHLKGSFSINLLVLVVILFINGENFLIRLRGCFCAHSWRATGEDALLLSVGSKQE